MESEATTTDNDGDEMTENGSTKGKFKFESTMRREEAVAYFEAIVSGLKQGSLHFKQGDRSLTVNPSSVVEIEVKAAKKGSDAKLSFELAWSADGDSELEISST
jgi:amphi-Trp domain-containing protein